MRTHMILALLCLSSSANIYTKHIDPKIKESTQKRLEQDSIKKQPYPLNKQAYSEIKTNTREEKKKPLEDKFNEYLRYKQNSSTKKIKWRMPWLK